VRKLVRRYPQSQHTSQNGIAERSRISLKGPERPYYTLFTGGSLVTHQPGYMRFATSMKSTTPPPLKTGKCHWCFLIRLPSGPRSWISTHLLPSLCCTTGSKAVVHVLTRVKLGCHQLRTPSRHARSAALVLSLLTDTVLHNST
jgi:hypothetical protein